jgi:hypothetical protein
MPTLVHRVEELQQKGIGFRGLQEVIDTTSATDKLGFHAFSAMAEFERKLIRERTLAGLRAALAGADLHVPSGGITGLLGPRGGVGAGGSHGECLLRDDPARNRPVHHTLHESCPLREPQVTHR